MSKKWQNIHLTEKASIVYIFLHIFHVILSLYNCDQYVYNSVSSSFNLTPTVYLAMKLITPYLNICMLFSQIHRFHFPIVTNWCYFSFISFSKDLEQEPFFFLA